MGFLEADKLNFRDTPFHPSQVLDLYENVFPYLRGGRENYEPEITIQAEQNVVDINEEVLLMYIKGLTALTKTDGLIHEVPVHDKLDEVHFFFVNDYSLKKDAPFGRTTTPFIPGIVEVEVFLDKKYSRKECRHFTKYYEEDISLAFFLDGDDLDWIRNFWRNFDRNSRRHREMALNQTTLHEIKHVSQSAQKFVDLYRSLLLAEEKHNMRLLGKEEAVNLLDIVYGQQRLHIPVEEDAEAYSIRALKLIYEEEKLPKILTLISTQK